MLKFDEIVRITGGKILRKESNMPVAFLLTDSRKAIYNEASLFFAINGKFHDGHLYIKDLYNNGIRQFIVERTDVPLNLEGTNFIYVDNSIKALQDIAAFHRSLFKTRIIGITGSNGKTIVKEWLSQLLSWKFNVIKSPKSYNSQIGVPLSVWQINENHEFGVFEAGISNVGEMKNLQAILKPETGIFTNIGSAHDEGFETLDQKIIEKLQLFQSSKFLILCSDYKNIFKLAKANLPGTRLITWGRDNADILVSYESNSNLVEAIDCIYLGIQYHFIFHFTDIASLENITHCIAFLLFLGWDASSIQRGINELSKVSMRLEMKRGINNCAVIDDTYNNDLISLEIGLNFMDNQSNKEKKTLILSDILQTGLNDNILYSKISQLINQYGIQKVIGIGEAVKTLNGLVNGSFIFHKDVSHFIDSFNSDEYQNEIILVKGARPFQFEKITMALQEKIHGTALEIDLDAAIFNFNLFRTKLKPDTKIMVMVKALAYGNGSLEIANLMQYHRADYLGVAFADEGVFLRKNGIGMPIMIMNPTPDSFDKILEFRLEPEIYSLSIFNQLIDFIKEKNQVLNIHLKLDTGMHRLGLGSEDLKAIIRILKKNKNIIVKSVFSHFAAADDSNYDEFTKQQAESFIQLGRVIEEELNLRPIRHIANSAAIVRFPEYHFDMVRLGIGLYGLGPGRIETLNLKPVSTLKTIISQIKSLPPGETVGYGRKGKINRNSKIATIAIGYADGFSRAFSNGVGRVIVNGKSVPVIGNVCMDMSMIDITDVNAKEGDEVIIFGKQNSIADLAISINTIPYEILTNISERVKRIYFKD